MPVFEVIVNVKVRYAVVVQADDAESAQEKADAIAVEADVGSAEVFKYGDRYLLAVRHDYTYADARLLEKNYPEGYTPGG